MLEKFKNFTSAHLDFKVYPVTWIAIANALLIVPCIMFLPKEFGYENGLLENIQLIALLVGFIICLLYPKYNKEESNEKPALVKFFRFAALVIVILFLREINCGRTIFFPVPGEVNTFYGWKEIKYGWLAHPLYGLFMTGVGVYFLINKLFITLWHLIKNVKFPVWNIVLMVIGMVWGTLAEEVFHNMVMEEITELLFYVALAGIIYLYTFNKNFQLKK
ncbi:MAG: hypothetical protein KH301_00080 [Brachyspira sp.]|nr:hypothetical protein [Brachyspira sp.]